MYYNPQTVEDRAEILLKMLFLSVVAVLLTFLPELVQAGTSQTFDGVATTTNSAVFGPLGKTIIMLGALGGAVIAAIKGSFATAGTGVGIAGLMYLTNQVTDSGAFSALISHY